MSSRVNECAPLPTSGLRGSRTRSYGSLVKSSLSPLRQRRIEHLVQPGETLQGLSLKYGVSMEDIKRANRLYTNDSIFLKTSLSIPVFLAPDSYNEQGLAEENLNQAKDTICNSDQHWKPVRNSIKEDCLEEELSPMDFLKRMDSRINQSKQAAVKKCLEGEKRFASLEAACASRAPDRRLTRSRSATSASRIHQQAVLGAVPLTITRCSKKLRDREDEIFEL
ncbi:lysM and putative peptidoglycan-binding domain-containing protein 1 [Osmerus eperlanus]|uniref:lysM and putative peptidoglycan-binding domain-containing protein 1 n=1 Tax=Osmerus eperlanus TaxID=29151 RepID=UPI002E1096F0